ncbi:MAG: putative transcriptional regulator [Microgenomates bacterium 39_7]|nr:MAG: putative transcriptional regulator [Microgenomates bacterium 39_7]
MQTKTIGQILAQERQKHRVTLQQLSESTHIKLEYLQALENNQFDLLPPCTFVKGFIKAYGRTFDLDHKSLLAILRRDYQENTQGELLPKEFASSVSARQNKWGPVTIAVLIVATIFFSLLGYIGWQWYSLNRPPHLEIYSPEENEFVSSQILVTGITSNESVVTVNAQPVAIQPDGSFRTEVYLPREGISTITIESTDQRGKTNIQQRTVYVKF